MWAHRSVSSTEPSVSSVIRARARTFYLASLFLPAQVRGDVHVLYAYCRAVDDLVDEPPRDWTRSQVADELSRWEHDLHSARPHHPLLARACAVAQQHGIPTTYLVMLIEGARIDLDLGCLQTRQELLHYSVLMAGSVGMLMAHLLGAPSERALQAARNLGIAMQLTNVLRDVAEDLDRGRIYLPAEDLDRFGCGSEVLWARRVTPALQMLLADLTHEARALYCDGMAGIALLDPSAQFAIHLASSLYARILDKIEQNDFDVFQGRAHLGRVEKWMLAVPAYMQHRQQIWVRMP